MGLLSLFKKDPTQDLEKATERLQADPVRALDLASRHTNHKDPAIRTQARALVDQARDTLLANSLQKSSTAEAEGDFADAADWVRAALQHLRDDARRPELEARLATLERRAEAEAAEAALRVPAVEEDDYGLDPDDDEADEALDEAAETRPTRTDRRGEEAAPHLLEDPESQYLLLIDTFADPVAERYEERPAEFRHAFLALNQGEAGTALPLLNQLVRRTPGDPVLHLERGRCRLMLGEAAAARQDFEAAWKELGDEPLTRDGSLTVSILWAEATLEEGDAAAVVERLGQDREAALANPDLSLLLAGALLRTERLEEARDFLGRACALHAKRQDLAHLLGEVLRRLGERTLAIQWLERAIAPSCSTGSCARPPLHLPSLRTLASLHLEVAEDVTASRGGTTKEATASLERVDDLLRWIAGAQQGQMTAPDFELVARLHQLRGDPEAAERARERGRRAGLGTAKATVEAPGNLAGATGEAAL